MESTGWLWRRRHRLLVSRLWILSLQQSTMLQWGWFRRLPQYDGGDAAPHGDSYFQLLPLWSPGGLEVIGNRSRFFVLQQLPGIFEGVLKLDLSFSCLLLPWRHQSALGMQDNFCLTLSHRAFRWFALLLPPFLSSWGGALFDGKCVLGLFSNIGSPLALGPACLTYHCSARLLLTFLITLRSPLVDS